MVIRDLKHAVSLSLRGDPDQNADLELSRAVSLSGFSDAGEFGLCVKSLERRRKSVPFSTAVVLSSDARCTLLHTMPGTANVDQVYDVYFLCDRPTRCSDSSVSDNHSVGAESLLAVFYCRLMRSISCCRGPGRRQSPGEGDEICSRIIMPMHPITYANAVTVNLLSTRVYCGG